MKFTRLLISLLVGLVLTIAWTSASAQKITAGHPFEQAAYAHPELKSVMAKYRELKLKTRQDMSAYMRGEEVIFSDEGNIENTAEENARNFDACGNALSVELIAFRAVADSVAKNRDKEFRKAMEEWFADQEGSLSKARNIGSMIAWTTSELMAWETAFREVKTPKLLKEMKMHKNWAIALSLSYTATQYDLAKHLAPKDYSGHAALFTGTVWGAKNMEDTLTFLSKNLKDELESLDPGERYKDKAEKALTLINEAGLLAEWYQTLMHGPPIVHKLTDNTIKAYDEYAAAAQPYIDETLLHKIGAPFKDLAFEDISEEFGELYGEVVARSRE